MISFPIANSLKLTDDFNKDYDIPYYRDVLYEDTNRGVNQSFKNEDTVSGVVFEAGFSTIILQVILSSNTYADETLITRTISGVTTSLGALDGARGTLVLDNGSYKWYNFRISDSGLTGEAYVNVYNADLENEFKSEPFYILADPIGYSTRNNYLTLEYSNEEGLDKDYYWTASDTQKMIIDNAYYSGLTFSTEKEQAEGVTNSELLYSDCRRVVSFTLVGVPEYLYEKIVKASYSTNLLVNSNPMVCESISEEGEQYDGLTNLLLTYKEKKTINTY